MIHGSLINVYIANLRSADDKIIFTIRTRGHLPFRFTNCKHCKAGYAQNSIVYNLTARNFVSLKDNPNKVYIKLKGLDELYENVK